MASNDAEHRNDKQPSSTINKDTKKSRSNPCSGVWELWVLAFFICIGLAVHYARSYNTRFSDFSPPNMLDVGRTPLGGFSSNLCENISISSTQVFNAYLLPHPADIDMMSRDNVNFNSTFSVEEDDLDKRSFYLLGGSSVSISTCFDYPAHKGVSIKALVFAGDADYNTWHQNQQNDAPAKQVNLIHDDFICKEHSRYEFSFNASRSDNYYVVFVAKSFGYFVRAFGDVDYELSLVKYDLHLAKLVCEEKTLCDATLDYASDQDIVLTFDTLEYPRVYLHSSCDRRLWYWLLMFAVVPAIIPFLMTCLCCCCWLFCRDKSDSSGVDGLAANRDSEDLANTTMQISNNVYSTPKDYTKCP